MLLIAPSEGLARRYLPQKSSIGDVVQDPDDGEIGGLITTFLNNGDSVVVQVADLLDASRPAGGMMLALSNTPGIIYLNRMYVIEGIDLGSPAPLELEWTARQRRRSDNSVIRTTRTRLNVPSYLSTTYENFPLLHAVPNSGSYVTLALEEDDGDWETDPYGSFVIDDESANYFNRDPNIPHFGGGQSRCGGPFGMFGVLSCPFSSTIFNWREVSFNLRWQQPVPPPIVAEIVGPSTVYPGYEYTWYVTNLAGAALPYQIQWYIDGQLVGTGESLTASFFNPASFSTLTVDVADQATYWEQANTCVHVNTGSCSPGDPNCNESLRLPPPESTSRKWTVRNRSSQH